MDGIKIDINMFTWDTTNELFFMRDNSITRDFVQSITNHVKSHKLNSKLDVFNSKTQNHVEFNYLGIIDTNKITLTRHEYFDGYDFTIIFEGMIDSSDGDKKYVHCLIPSKTNVTDITNG